MSIIVAVQKGNDIVIAADTTQSEGSLKISANYLLNNSKLVAVNDGFVGIAGWLASADIFQHIAINHPDKLDFSSKMKVFESALNIHKLLKDDYFIETSEGDKDQPVESSQLDMLIVNKNGIFELESYRSVSQYQRYWAIGSGSQLALGALHAVYDLYDDASQIAEIAIKAACALDDSCGLPLHSQLIKAESKSSE